MPSSAATTAPTGAVARRRGRACAAALTVAAVFAVVAATALAATPAHGAALGRDVRASTTARSSWARLKRAVSAFFRGRSPAPDADASRARALTASDEDEARRWNCRTGEDAPAAARATTLATARRATASTTASGFPAAPDYILQNVYFHIVYQSDGTGYITQEQMAQQIAQLNLAYSGGEDKHAFDVRVRFQLQGFNYVEDDDMFANCGPATAMQEVYAVSPATTVNVYTCDLSFLIGETTMPGQVYSPTWQPLPSTDPQYGVMLYYAAFAGGTL